MRRGWPAHIGLSPRVRGRRARALAREFRGCTKNRAKSSSGARAHAERAFRDRRASGRAGGPRSTQEGPAGTPEEAAFAGSPGVRERRRRSGGARDHGERSGAATDGVELSAWHGQRAASHYRFEEAAAFARKATQIDPEDPDAQVDLGLYLLRTGDEKEARVALDLA
jgi:hypothetical protein